MELSLRYMYTRTLALEPSAEIADEHVAPLDIQWVGVASTRFASHTGFLYFVTDEREVPSPALDPESMFGCVVPESLGDRCRGIPRIVVPDDCDMDRLFDHLVGEMEKYRRWHDMINDLLIADAPYQHMVDATARLVPRPMYVADANWRMIAHVDFEMNEISATWHYQLLHDGLYPHHIVEALNRTGDYSRISNLPRAALLDSQVYTLRILAKPVRYQGKLVGYYFMIDTWGDLGYCEVEIAQEFGTMIAPLMAARNAKEGHMAGFQDSLIIHVLDGLTTSKREIAQQLKTDAHWPVESDFRLATVQYEPDEYENHLLHMQTMGLLMGDFDSRAYSYRDTAVVVFHEAEQERDDFMEHLERCAVSLKRPVIVSSRFNDFSQLKSYYDQNAYVHERMETEGDPEPRLIQCDKSFRSLLADCCKGTIPSCYGADVLYAYDQEHNTKYCETLLAYLALERNALLTSQALFLHRNTLRNRLTKIEEIIGTNLDNVDERIHLMIALGMHLHASK